MASPYAFGSNFYLKLGSVCFVVSHSHKYNSWLQTQLPLACLRASAVAGGRLYGAVYDKDRLL